MCRQAKRLVEFDLLKCFAIFLVLWGHSIQYLLSSDYWNEPLYRHIYSFHMPLFMMISGFFFAKTTHGGFMVTLKKKFQQLLLPAFMWICIFTVSKMIITGISSSSSNFNSFEYWVWALENGVWFLKSAFVCSLLGFFACKAVKHKVFVGGVICMVVQLIFDQYTQVAYMFPCFFVGMILQWNYEGVIKVLSIPKIRYLVTSVLFLFLLLGNMHLDADLHQQLLKSFEMPLWTNPYNIFFRMFRLLVGISGSLFFIALFIILFKTYNVGRIGNFFSKLGAETLGIYILQSYILEGIFARHINFDGVNFMLLNFVIAPLISGAVLICSYGIIRIIRQSRILSFLLLGSHLSVTQE